MKEKMQTVLMLFSLFLAVSALIFSLQGQQAPAETPAPAAVLKKVVYHVDFAGPRRLSAMITSINNMVNTYQEDLAEYDVRIVFVAHGIRFLTKDKLKGTPFEEDKALAASKNDLMTRLGGLHQIQGVKLELCEITRTSISLDKEKLMPGVELVQSGVVRIAELQHQGFAYLKIQ